MIKDNKRYCDRCGVELTKRNNVCGFELCDKCNEVLGQQLAIMTNGEKMISAFPNGEVLKCEKGVVFSTGGWCHAYADEWWNAEYKEPTTENDLGVDCVSRQAISGYIDYILSHGMGKKKSFGYIKKFVDKLPSVTPQLSVPEVTALAEWTEKLTKASEDAYNKGYADGVKSVNICPHCGEYIGEEE